MALSLTNVNTFYGESHILNDISMTIDAGVSTALLGRNGAGKSTLVRSVMGFTKARSGDITWAGRSVRGLPPYRVSRSGLAVVPQGRHIFKSLTVAENLKIAGRGGKHAADKRFDLDRVFELFPRLRERAGNFGDQLSGGEQQMLAIGRALMTNPTFILMDEPSEGLAPIIVDALADTIRMLRELGLGLLLVEQNLGLALDCTQHAFILSKGQIVWSGPIETIRDDHELRKRHLAV